MKKYIIITLNNDESKKQKTFVFDKAFMMARTRGEVVDAYSKVEGILDIYTLSNV